MKIFVVSATGALGRQLVPRLVAAGHDVVGMTRSVSKQDVLRGLGAIPVVADALDPAAVAMAVAEATPDVIVHELTALAAALDVRRFDRDFAATNRLRTEATDHLLAAGRAIGVRRFVAQSFAGWPFARSGGPVKTEDDQLDPSPVAAMRRTLDAIRYLEGAVVNAEWTEGVVLRYGSFYGPGTTLWRDSKLVEQVRRRRFPVIGAGGGVWSFVHVEDAADATVAAVERGPRGIYNIVDDEAATVAEWLPALASAVGARRPRRVPKAIGRLLAGDVATVMMTNVRRASNAKAKATLHWQPRHASWRAGFAELAAA